MNQSSHSTPSRIRYLIVFLTTLMAVLLYLDRYSITLLERYVTADLGLTDEQSAIYLSMFFYSYALAQVPSGWLTDWFGARLTLTLYILGWSFFTAAMGLVHGFFFLIVIRVLFGITQAGAYPTAANILSRWMPISTRGTASGIVSFGGRIGGAIVPVLTGVLMVTLIPIETSSQFRADEIRDVKLFAAQASNREEANQTNAAMQSAREEVRQQLSPELRASLTESPSGELTPELGEELNRLLTEDDLIPREVAAGLQLPDEAKTLLEQANRTTEETERLNRLLLEAAFAGSFKEIYGRSWRTIVLLYGLLGILVGTPFWFFFRNRPEEHPRCNEAEVALIRGPFQEIRQEENKSPTSSERMPPIPWKRIFLNFSVWCSCLVQIGTNIGWTFIVTWLPRYLSEVHQVPLTERALMTSLPMIFGIVGNFLGGWLTDAMTVRFGARWGRSIPIAVTRIGAALMFLFCLFVDSPWGVTILLCFMAFFVDLGIASVWAFYQDIGGRYVATILGWGNMWGNLAAGVSPMLLNFTTKHFSWNITFLTCSGCFVLAGVIAMGINATRKIDDVNA
ncbi:MAG: MFS transporter [Planctomycetaceae bacterium]|nr:MFS transporter [Planctomycetaceae bacterium]